MCRMSSRSLIACALILGVVEGMPKGYIINEANGIGYRMVYQAQPWDKAKEICELEGAKLAVPKSQEEFTFIQRLVGGMQYPAITGTQYRLLVWLGINNLHDCSVWRNIDGENIEETGYHTWTGLYNGDAHSNSPSEPHCVGVDAVNPGLRDFWCHRHQPYICQKSPYSTKHNSNTQ